jgi:hypothetical protein
MGDSVHALPRRERFWGTTEPELKLAYAHHVVVPTRAASERLHLTWLVIPDYLWILVHGTIFHLHGEE